MATAERIERTRQTYQPRDTENNLLRTPETPMPGEIIAYLTMVVAQDRDLRDINGAIILDIGTLSKLLIRVENAEKGSLDPRIDKLETRLPGKDPTIRWLGGHLWRMRASRSRSRAEIVAQRIATHIELAAFTPAGLEPQVPPQEEILTEELLKEAYVDFILSLERPDSVASQLLDLIRMFSTGVVITSKEKVYYDFTLPSAFLEILRRLKHTESEGIFKSYLLDEVGANSENALLFLQGLVNFTTFLDSRTHVDIWKPPKVEGHENEVLVKPFDSLVRTVEAVKNKLAAIYVGNSGHPRRREITDIAESLQHRYGEVFRRFNRRSIYTSRIEALTPSPDAYASWINSVLRSEQYQSRDPSELAIGVVKSAESTGVTDLRPLLSMLANWPELLREVEHEARLVGLLLWPNAYEDTIRTLAANPWEDAARVDYSKIIRADVTHITFGITPGSLAPNTLGHINLFQKAQAHILSLPEEDLQNNRVYQTFLLLIPVTDIKGVTSYEKTAARLGKTTVRLEVLLLSLADKKFRRDRLLVTTELQPAPQISRSTEDRAVDTLYGAIAKARSDRRRVGLAAGFDVQYFYIFGSDEVRFTGNPGDPRELAPPSEQKPKVHHPGGVLVVRGGWFLDVMRNCKRLLKETGIETVILTPGSLHSSTGVVDEIKRTGETRAVHPAAREISKQHWNEAAIRAREKTIRRPSLSTRYSISQAYRQLIGKSVTTPSDSN